jgi:hypothetical protein
VLTPALTLSDPTPFALSPLRTGTFFAQPEKKDVCRPEGAWARWGTFRVSVFYSFEFVFGFFFGLFCTKHGMAEDGRRCRPVLRGCPPLLFKSSVSDSPGGGSCFADVLVPGRCVILPQSSRFYLLGLFRESEGGRVFIFERFSGVHFEGGSAVLGDCTGECRWGSALRFVGARTTVRVFFESESEFR